MTPREEQKSARVKIRRLFQGEKRRLMGLYWETHHQTSPKLLADPLATGPSGDGETISSLRQKNRGWILALASGKDALELTPEALHNYT